MKKYLFTLVAMLVMTMTANAMTYEEASAEALFLTDKMAYELGLSDEQYDAAYEINLDYLMELETSNDLYGTYWSRRNLDMSYVLTATQYNLFLNAAYFYRPVTWLDGFRFSIYERYTDAALLFFAVPTIFSTYFGGHSWVKNGNKSWYKGRTFSVKNILKPAPKKVDIKAASKKVATANKDKIPVNSRNHSSAKPANNSNSKPANNNSKPSTSSSSKPSTSSSSKPSTSSSSKPSTSSSSKPSTSSSKPSTSSSKPSTSSSKPSTSSSKPSTSSSKPSTSSSSKLSSSSSSKPSSSSSSKPSSSGNFGGKR